MEHRAAPGDLGGFVSEYGLELRGASIVGEFTDLDEGKRQVQVSFPHDTIDSYKTVFDPECFRESYEQRLPLMVWQHDLKEPIGRGISAKVLKGHDELVGQLDDYNAVPRANQAMSQIRSRTLTDFSFGFKNAVYQRADSLGKGVRRITKGFMAEFSPVSIGSIPGAGATGVREDGADVADVMPVEQIIYLRDAGLLLPDAAAEMILEQHPELDGKIVVQPLADSRDTGEMDGADPEGDDDMNWEPEWTAQDAGLHTATGPNGELMTVAPSAEEDGHLWVVSEEDGAPIGSGKEIDPDAAKMKAQETVMPSGPRSDDIDSYIQSGGPVNADLVRAALTIAFPSVAEALADADITLTRRAYDDGAPGGMQPDPSIPVGSDTSGTDTTYVASLASAVDAALDSGIQWMQGVDVASLPDKVQQALALFQAAGTAVDMLLDAMGIEDPDDTDDDEGRAAEQADLEARAADNGWSTKPWSDINQGDYTPEQWKSACLIVEGDGSTKDQCSLPVKEPDGTYNVNGIAAAAGRLDQTDASDDAKKAAAKTLMGLYGKMKKPVPPKVLGLAKRSDEEVAAEDAKIAETQARLDARLARRRPAPVAT